MPVIFHHSSAELPLAFLPPGREIRHAVECYSWTCPDKGGGALETLGELEREEHLQRAEITLGNAPFSVDKQPLLLRPRCSKAFPKKPLVSRTPRITSDSDIQGSKDAVIQDLERKLRFKEERISNGQQVCMVCVCVFAGQVGGACVE